jgi:3'-5' exoribonuclease Rv2179c-like domain
MSRPELYISIDIETDGPAPGLNSMRALGAVAFAPDGKECGGWYATIEPLPEATTDKQTMEWWDTQPDSYREITASPTPASYVIPHFVRWLEEDLRGNKLIAVGWPIAFDFAFVNYYCHRFTGRNPLGFAGLDIRSYANGLAGHASYYGLKEADILDIAGPVDRDGLRDHFALDDAIGQGRLFIALLNKARKNV